jgi:hypothetical protein
MSVDIKSYRAAMEATFTFPGEVAASTGYKSVTVRELSASMESTALARAGMDGSKLVHELVKESVVRAVLADGTVEQINTGDDSIDKFWTAIGPKGRTLVGNAYTHINQPRPSESADFLASVQISVR